MKMLEINEKDLVFTDKDTPVKFKQDDVIDKLIVINYMGKQYVSSRNTYEPIYKVKCECGTIELRSHRYLWNEFSINGRCCYACARKNSSRPRDTSRRGRPPKRREVDLSSIKTDDHYKNIVDTIWRLPIWEVNPK